MILNLTAVLSSLNVSNGLAVLSGLSQFFLYELKNISFFYTYEPDFFIGTADLYFGPFGHFTKQYSVGAQLAVAAGLYFHNGIKRSDNGSCRQ